MYKTIKYSSVALMFLLIGCSTPVAEPTIPPSKVESATTTYSNVLRNFNQMIDVFNNGKPIKIGVNQIANKSGEKDKLPIDITDVLKASFNSIGDKVNLVFQVSDNEQYYSITGVISGFSNIREEYKGGDSEAEFGKGKGNTNINASMNGESKITRLTITLNPSNSTSGSFVSNASVRNRIEIHQKSNAREGSLYIFGIGGGMNKSVTKSEGIDLAIQTVVDLSAIEIIGKIKNFPYWLLTKGRVNENIINYLNDKFLDDKPYQQIYKISYLLSFKNMGVRPTKVVSNSLKEAIKRYKQTHNMKVNTNISQELYESLLRG